MTDATPEEGIPGEPVLEWGLSFARGYFELAMLNHAQAELDRLPARHQDNSEVMSLRSHILLSRRRWKGVVENARRALDLFPQSPEFYIHAATAFDMMGRPEDGRRVWQSAPEAVRTSGFFHLHVARFEARLGNVDSARDHLAHAFHLDPTLRSVAGRDPNLTQVLVALSKN